MKKMYFLIVLSIIILTAAAECRTFETICGIDNNFIAIQDIEIEQGLITWKDYINLANTDLGIIPIRIGWGVMHNMEVGVKIPYIFVENSSNGFADISIYQKFKFIDESAKAPSVAGGLELNLPTGNLDNLNQFADSKLDIKLFISAGKDLPQFRVFGSLAINFLEAGDNVEITYNTGVNLFLSKKCKLVGELTGVKVGEDAKYGFKSQAYIVPGLIYDTDKNLNLKFGIPLGMSDRSADYGFNFSLNHIF